MPYTVAVAILTLNEAARISACIASAQFADQVLVVDNGSSDGTQNLARTAGAEVVEYADWQGFAEQRNRALAHVSCDYVFFLDADEVLSAELQAEIRAAANGADVIWKVVWTQVAFGRPLTRMAHSGGVARMFKMSSLQRFEGAVHERAITAAPLPTRVFKTRLLHHSRETVYGSLLKMAQYVQLGAAKRAQSGKRGGLLRGMASAFSIFIKNYFFRRACLCGAEGFLHSYLLAQEAFFRYAALAYDAQNSNFHSKRQHVPGAKSQERNAESP